MTRRTTPGNYPHHNIVRIEKARTTMPKFKHEVLDETTLPTRKLASLKPRLKELVHMLEYCRPHGTDTEEAFIAKYIDSLPHMQKDGYGNRWCKVGREEPTIAWSCHTDTVHEVEGKQALEIDAGDQLALDTLSAADCLGADCTAGVWLMRRMILAGKPGLYIFHREEESGGMGSKWLASNTPELVANIQAMIALDRRGYSSVITEQTTGKTASKAFAKSLAAQLGGEFQPDDGGIFTDSAFYSHLIPECTNISVGYFGAHSSYETLDYQFIDSLLLSLLKLDYSKLTIARKPEPAQSRYSSSYYSSSTWKDYYQGADYDGEWQAGDNTATHDYLKEQWEAKHSVTNYSDTGAYVDRDLVYLIRREPEAVAHLMEEMGLTEDDIYQALNDMEEKQRRKEA